MSLVHYAAQRECGSRVPTSARPARLWLVACLPALGRRTRTEKRRKDGVRASSLENTARGAENKPAVPGICWAGAVMVAYLLLPVPWRNGQEQQREKGISQ